eukprot:TRINITY_DN4920_c0_g1_i1.p1 TRINITY_DN4920_c0_g1~~TRINITY_DN4920_c0_g1_i1.p1  ORF type:complete len:453 (-),score=87.86 TRINITY_DN4920_c0_g1_i1:934-2292(-)
MANQVKGKAYPVNWSYTPRQSHLPPKSPFPIIGPAFADYSPSLLLAQRSIQVEGREGFRQHQRTSSESILIDEQPSWLDELLNEPETPVKKGSHRRSASDSVAFLDIPTTSRIESNTVEHNSYNSNVKSLASRRHFDSDCSKSDNRIHNPYQAKPKRPPIKNWEALGSLGNSYKNALNNGRENRKVAIPSSPSQRQNSEGTTSSVVKEDLHQHQHTAHDTTSGSIAEKKETSHPRPADTDADTKRAKQQFAQRSRVRKLQYISELERNVSALQAEESEVSAEVAFLNQQRIILTLENQALKQRIAGLAQEKLIKDAEHELLVKEAQRLKLLYHQQLIQQQQSSVLSRLHQMQTSVDYELQQLQFSKLSISSANQVESKPSASCGGFVIPTEATGMSTVSEGNENETTLNNGRPDASKSSMSSCMLNGSNNIDNRRMVSGGGLMPVDYMLRNS